MLTVKRAALKSWGSGSRPSLKKKKRKKIKKKMCVVSELFDTVSCFFEKRTGFFFLGCDHLVTGSLKLQALGTTEVSSVFSSSFLAPRHQ